MMSTMSACGTTSSSRVVVARRQQQNKQRVTRMCRAQTSSSSTWSEEEKQQKNSIAQQLGQGLSALALASTMSLAPVDAANASEIEILQTPAPTAGYIVDDAGIMSRASAGQINKTLKELEDQTGYHLNVITVRKLVFEQDPYAFGDKVLETWYPTLEEGNNKGNLLLVKTAKEAAVVGGPQFLKAVGDDVLESVLTKNVPINLEYEKFNEALTSSVDRIAAVLEGKPDPGPPAKFEKDTSRTFKTKEETGAKREVFSNVVVGLLVISFVVPMLQYFGYVTGDPDFDD
jgi:uncharacterized membrane protein YgcG